MPITLKCENCEQAYAEKASRAQRSKYCSVACKSAAQRKPRPSLQQPLDHLHVPVLNANHLCLDLKDAMLSTYPWYSNNGYAVSRIYGKLVFVHIVIIRRMLGRDLCPGEFVDHIDGNRLNNRRGNLRVATRSQNSYNRPKRRHSASAHKGVFKSGRNWHVQINAEGNRFCLGSFHDELEAAYMYDQWALQLHGEYARLNVL
ncbi:HNH endonuclease [Pseudarthrobacter sp. H2]|uniref:HNH endonuclease n=1 Tax=Pseudarthrobacter sp. H2 TaxID=3418415 RepID=UPI003CEFC747